MRALPLLLLACSAPVTVSSRASPEAPLDLWIHDAQGAELVHRQIEGEVEVLVGRGESVSVSAAHGDPVYSVLSETVADVRPGDDLTFAVAPWPTPVPSDPAPAVRLSVPGALPDGARSLWVGLIECGSARLDGEDYVAVLSRCEGAATPVALALDALSVPVAYRMSATTEPDALVDETVPLDGPWREDWTFVRVDIDGPASAAEVVVELDVGGWLHSEVLPGSPLSVAFPLPSGIELSGAVSLAFVGDGVRFAAPVASGEHLGVDLGEAPVVEDVVLSPGFSLTASGEVASVSLVAVSQSDGVSRSWAVRAPAGETSLPDGFLDAEGLEAGFVRASLSELPWRKYRTSGGEGFARWHRDIDL